MNTVVFFDLETRRLVRAPKQPEIPGHRYCNGWTDYEGMGISVVGWAMGQWAPGPHGDGIIDWSKARWALGNEPGLALFAEDLRQADCRMSFNGKRFDDPLLRAHGIDIPTHYDLLEEVRLAAYGSTTHKGMPRGHSYKLELIGEVNGCPKSGNGADAPVWFQQGRVQDVAEYCCGDVDASTTVLDLGLAGELIDPNTGGKLKLRSIEEVMG